MNGSSASRLGLELKSVLSKVESLAPLCLAEEWDNVGLLIEPTAPHIVKTVFLCNDLTELVMGELGPSVMNLVARMIGQFRPPWGRGFFFDLHGT